jgi:hypothetical protein
MDSTSSFGPKPTRSDDYSAFFDLVDSTLQSIDRLPIGGSVQDGAANFAFRATLHDFKNIDRVILAVIGGRLKCGSKSESIRHVGAGSGRTN